MHTKSPYYDLVKHLGKQAPDYSKIGFIISCDDWYYPFFEENLTWKLFPLKYKNLVKNQNYNDYDYLIFSEDKQLYDIDDKQPLKFNYTVENNQIIYNQNNNDSITVYLDKDAAPIVSGKPFIACDIIDLNKIPANFKLEGSFGDDKFQFYLYKKINM
ncbi:MAG: hypothetical protein MZV70_76760 [Desulfobacterales bacterium]|nr:hypothetical protein [Desulfobacterales bacterium]